MTALLLISSSRAKSLMRIFSNVFSFQLPVSSEYPVLSTQFLFKIVYADYQNTAISAIIFLLRAAFRRAHALPTSKSHPPAARFPRHPQRQPRVPALRRPDLHPDRRAQP